MHITLETDYAIRIVEHLAKTNQKTDAKTISARTGVSIRFALKILHKLVANGVVKSYKGAKGGYMLANAPRETNLRQVYEAVEGPYRLSRCVDADVPCTHESAGLCPYYKVFDEISREVRQKLEKTHF